MSYYLPLYRREDRISENLSNLSKLHSDEVARLTIEAVC